MEHLSNFVSYHGHVAKRDLTAETVRKLLDYNPETGVLTWRKREEDTLTNRKWNAKHVGKVAGSLRPSGYREIGINGVLWREHRVIWLHYYGEHARDTIDHINGRRDDNRIENLRDAAHFQNKQNVGPKGNQKSRYKGVYKHTVSGKWIARITRHLGCFDTEEEARDAYEREAKYEFREYYPDKLEKK